MATTETNLITWMKEKALPLWASRGWDKTHGGFTEQLNPDGRVSDPGFKRVRVQGRQLFCFSTAAILNWNKEAAALADQGFDFIKKSCRVGKGPWARRLNSDGSILDAELDLYDTAFIVLGLSTYYRLTKNKEALDLIGETLPMVKTHLSVPGGRGYRQSKGDLGLLRQNPHMHWFEAMLFCFEASKEQLFLDEARKIFALAWEFIIDPKSGALRELFDDQWTPLAETGGILVEPGHHYEWAWLLDRAGKHMPLDQAIGKSILKFADQYGVNPATGLVYDQVNDQGKLTQPTHRLWVQTEALKAWLIRKDAGEPEQEKRINQIESNLLKYYFAREMPGTWGDRLEASGKDLGGPVPASSMYHIMVCVTELSAWRSARGKN